MDIYAPGAEILSAEPDPRNHCYVEKSGTCMAAAHVAGAMAIHMSGLEEAPAPHEMVSLLHGSTLSVSTFIESQNLSDSVRQLYIKCRYIESGTHGLIKSINIRCITGLCQTAIGFSHDRIS